jgi:hypothetical protein
LDAVEMLRKQAAVMERIGQGQQAYKVYLSEVVLLLHVGDFIGAEKAFQDALQCVCLRLPCCLLAHVASRAGSFFQSTEGRAANKLLDAFEHREEADVKKLVQAQVFGFLEATVCVNDSSLSR